MKVGDKCIIVDDSSFNGRHAVIVKVFLPSSYGDQYGIQVEGFDYGPTDRRSRETTGQACNWHRATTANPSGPYLCIKPYERKKSGLTVFMEKHYEIPSKTA